MMSFPASAVVAGLVVAAAVVVRLRGSRRYSDGYIDGLNQKAKLAKNEK
jgi:hypothetical protein